jgi:sortase A
MWKKRISLILISLGMVVVVYNVYWLNKGLTAGSPPEITTKDFKEQSEPIKKVRLYKNNPKKGENIGVLTIPKLNRSLPILEGASPDVLKLGVGHFEGSVLPGENNNSVLSGHRDTVFRGLGDVGVNDDLIIETNVGQFLYKIKKVRIVDQDDRTVIVPKPKSTLTVTTCYPFGFIGNAPQRYVLVAELVSQNLANSK